MPYRMRVRKFLNRPGYHAGAYGLADIEDSTNLKKDRNGRWPWVDISLVLSDCDRVVSYDFNLEPRALGGTASGPTRTTSTPRWYPARRLRSQREGPPEHGRAGKNRGQAVAAASSAA